MASEYVQGLRDLSDFLESNPEYEPHNGLTVYWFVGIESPPDDVEASFVRMAEGLPDAEHTVDVSYFNSTARFGPHRLQVTRPINLQTKHPAELPPHPLAEVGVLG